MAKPDLKTIATPTPGPVLPPPPEPKPWSVPVMHAEKPAVVVPLARVKRVTTADLDELMAWAVPRLKEKRYPRLAEGAVYGWFQSLIYANNALFVRSENVVGAALVSTDVLEPFLEVNERFLVRKIEGVQDEIALVYQEFERWAREIHAVRLIIGQCSDCNMQQLGGKVSYGKGVIMRLIDLKKAA
jgi:hypothetical protein